MAQMTLMTGAERRRRWSDAERLRILEASFAPGAVVADVGRQFEVATSLIYKWRRDAMAAQAPFVPAVVVAQAGGGEPALGSEASIMVQLPGGTRVMIGAKTPGALVAVTLKVLTR